MQVLDNITDLPFSVVKSSIWYADFVYKGMRYVISRNVTGKSVM